MAHVSPTLPPVEEPLLSYDEWLAYVFDNLVPDDGLAWYWHDDPWDPLLTPVTTVRYLTDTFENAIPATAPYTDAQIAQALDYLVNNACSSHMFALLNDAVPLADRVRCVESFFALFRDLFAPRCSPHLGHLRTMANPTPDGANPLDTICYMWWDTYPLGGNPADAAGDRLHHAALDVMARTLSLESDACRENALHGLGHWSLHYGDETARIIDAFLARTPGLRPELHRYALAARGGCIL